MCSSKHVPPTSFMLLTIGSHAGVCAPRRHLARFGDIFGFHKCGRGGVLLASSG